MSGSLREEFQFFIRVDLEGTSFSLLFAIGGCWDEDQSAWDDIEHDFAPAWRSKPKWVAFAELESEVREGPASARSFLNTVTVGSLPTSSGLAD